MMKSKCCIYCRISGEQTERNQLAINNQLEKLRSLAEGLGLEVASEMLVYENETNAGRTSLKTMVQNIKDGEYSTVLVESVDRLTRNAGDAIEMAELFENHQVKIYTPEGETQLPEPEILAYGRMATMEQLM